MINSILGVFLSLAADFLCLTRGCVVLANSKPLLSLPTRHIPAGYLEFAERPALHFCSPSHLSHLRLRRTRFGASLASPCTCAFGARDSVQALLRLALAPSAHEIRCVCLRRRRTKATREMRREMRLIREIRCER